MTENSDIATALASLDQAISNMTIHSSSTATTSTACTPLIDTYNTATTFDLSSQSGSTAYADACVTLSKPWYSQVKTFP